MRVKVPYRGNNTPPTPIGNFLTAKVTLELSPEAYGGRYVEVIYTVKNEGSPQNFRIGSHGDVMIHDNDCARIWREGKALVMDGQSRNIYRFNQVAPTCFSTWFGYYRRCSENLFSMLLIEDGRAIYDDNSMAWSWKYETVEPGETWERYVLIGTGDLSTPPPDPVVTLTSASAKLGDTITATISGIPEGSTLYLDVMGGSHRAYR